jgi:predicted helicase
MQAFLKTYPVYQGKFIHVWLWSDFPYRDSISNRDTGIDLVAQTIEGQYWAVQCKFRDSAVAINKPEVDSFISTSGRTFRNAEGKETAFDLRLWISTTNAWSSEAENAIRNQRPPVARISLTDLENAPVDWGALESGLWGAEARRGKKQLRRHQQAAVDACVNHFQSADRGKLIMACGAGKTFTSL